MYEAVNGVEIGKRLKQLRQEAGMTTMDLAQVMGTSPSAITNYETGIRIPRDEIKVKIAEYFGRSVEAIFYPQKSDEL